MGDVIEVCKIVDTVEKVNRKWLINISHDTIGDTQWNDQVAALKQTRGSTFSHST